MDISVDSESIVDVNEGGREGSVVKVPVTVITAGVFNGALRDREAVKKSAVLWEGMPIIRTKVGEIDDHPPEKIVTCRKQIVGQVRNVKWDDVNGRVRGEAWFNDELGSPPELMEFVKGGGKLGVSGAYFHDTIQEEGEFDGNKYSSVYYNLVPNNLAIVTYPACPLGTCGVNTESKNIEVKNMSEMTVDMNELVTLRTESATAKVAAAESEKIKKELGEKVVAVEAERAKVAAENSELVKKLAEVSAERDALKAEIEKAAVEAKKQVFLGKFPVENRAAAESELLGAYMEDAGKFVIEHGNRYAELLAGTKVAAKESAKEFVPEVDAESKMYDEMGVPTKDELIAALGIVVKKDGA